MALGFSIELDPSSMPLRAICAYGKKIKKIEKGFLNKIIEVVKKKKPFYDFIASRFHYPWQNMILIQRCPYLNKNLENLKKQKKVKMFVILKVKKTEEMHKV